MSAGESLPVALRTGLRKSSARARRLALCGALIATAFAAQPAQAHLQCVPYARDISGIEIHGNARTWWNQADGSYDRGSAPRVGAVMAMSASRAMPLGHVAVVSRIVDSRHILIDQANWAGPGVIEHDVLVEDASTDGDWSEVRVWYAPANAMGARLNPVAGFIYPTAPSDEGMPAGLAVPGTQIAEATPGAEAGTLALQAFFKATDAKL